MLDRLSDPTSPRIKAIVDDVLAKYSVKVPVGAETELATFGITSIDMVELMLGIEAEFDISIPPAEITLANFKSIGSIQAMVSRLTSTT